MSRLLIGMSGGVYAFDADGDAVPRLLFAGVQAKALATDPADPARVYCATYDRGAWRSDDAGETWRPIGTPQDYYRPANAQGIGPRETSFISVNPKPGANGRHSIWVGTEPSRLYRSDDLGATFEQVTEFDLPSKASWSFPPRPGTHHVQWIAHDQGSIHVAIEFGATLRSLDGGRTFTDRLPNSPRDTHTLRSHSAAPGRLYAALGDAFFQRGHSFAESRDGGKTWRYVGRGLEAMPYLYGLAVNAGNPDDIRVAASPDPYAAHFTGGSSIFRRDADRWVEDAAGFPREHSLTPVIEADPAHPGRWFALSNLGLFAKQAAADTWCRIAVRDEWRDMNPMSLAICVRPALAHAEPHGSSTTPRPSMPV